MSVVKLFIDGASRGNPGPSGAGVHISNESRVLYTGSFFLGTRTNNQAEYYALVLGIICAKNILKSTDKFKIISDSELLIRQINHVYAVRNPELLKLHNLAEKLLAGIDYSAEHVLRENNQAADRLANYAIDKKTIIPTELLALLQAHGLLC